MCTLVLAWQAFRHSPIVAAANRDEMIGRPSAPPTRYLDDPVAIAPRDETAGGTWIGYNDAGLFVGITNRWVDREGDRSRGQLVRDCLGCRSTSEAVAHLRQSTAAESYAGFNLVVADADRAVLAEWDGRLTLTEFDPGIHVVVNVGADGEFFQPAARPEAGTRQAANAGTLRAALEPTDGESAEAWLDRAGSALGNHDYGVCIHGDGFGTRSTSLIRLEQRPAGFVDHYQFADGPPCRTEFTTVEQHL